MTVFKTRRRAALILVAFGFVAAACGSEPADGAAGRIATTAATQDESGTSEPDEAAESAEAAEDNPAQTTEPSEQTAPSTTEQLVVEILQSGGFADVSFGSQADSALASIENQLGRPDRDSGWATLTGPSDAGYWSDSQEVLFPYPQARVVCWDNELVGTCVAFAGNQQRRWLSGWEQSWAGGYGTINTPAENQPTTPNGITVGTPVPEIAPIIEFEGGEGASLYFTYGETFGRLQGSFPPGGQPTFEADDRVFCINEGELPEQSFFGSRCSGPVPLPLAAGLERPPYAALALPTDVINTADEILDASTRGDLAALARLTDLDGNGFFESNCCESYADPARGWDASGIDIAAGFADALRTTEPQTLVREDGSTSFYWETGAVYIAIEADGRWTAGAALGA